LPYYTGSCTVNRCLGDENEYIKPPIFPQFTVKVGTVFEHARLPLHKALQATYLLCSSKKGISANQLSRALEISLKAAWFLSHRVREAMGELHFPDQLDGEGKIVEADETYVGGKERNKHRSKRNADHIGGVGKRMVFSLGGSRRQGAFDESAVCQRCQSPPCSQSPNRRR
jgi:hypothetical protein